MKAVATIVLATMLFAGGASAQTPSQLITAKQLLDLCTSQAPDDSVRCNGYIQGAFEEVKGDAALPGVQPLCLPLNVSNSQLRDIVIKVLRDHPARRLGASLAYLALHEAFTCNK